MRLFSLDFRNKKVECQRLLRRMIDLTVPNKTDLEDAARLEKRFNRSLPLIMCPWEAGAPVLSEMTMAVTKDISDQGVGLILNQPFHAEEVVLGFCLEEVPEHEPWFFLGTRQHNIAIGGGFWVLGIGLTEVMSLGHRSQVESLIPFARRLLPSS